MDDFAQRVLTNNNKQSLRFPTADLVRWRQLDGGFILVAFLILTWGLIMLTSASISLNHKNPDYDPFHYFKLQFIYLIIGSIIGSAWIALVSLKKIQSWEMQWLGLTFAMLIVVLIPGLSFSANGATRWINLGIIKVQTSEIAKLSLIIYMASFMTDSERLLQKGSAMVWPITAVIMCALLLLKQPDFGSVVVLLTVVLAMLWIAGANVFVWFALIFLGLGAGLLLINIAGYRADRLATFLQDPFADPYGKGFQLVQSLIAFGRGGWTGEGLGNSMQKLAFLPEVHTDFIYAMTAEELGWIGCLILWFLYTWLFWRGFKIGARALANRHRFAGILAYGLTTWLALQVYLNMGVNLGMLPTKGLALPMFSYGGSNLLVTCFTLAILVRIDYENRAGWRADLGTNPQTLPIG